MSVLHRCPSPQAVARHHRPVNVSMPVTSHIVPTSLPASFERRYVGWFVYKHPGHKVIVKRRGDLIVRPTYTENAVARYVFHAAAKYPLIP